MKEEEKREEFEKQLKKDNYTKEEVVELLLAVYQGTYEGCFEAFDNLKKEE